MFVISITYKKSLDKVDQYLEEHRAVIAEGYKNNYLIASGPKVPRTGGVIFSHLTDRSKLEEFIKRDPFYIHKIADYEIIEFTPTKCHPDFAGFLDDNENLAILQLYKK